MRPAAILPSNYPHLVELRSANPESKATSVK